MEKLSEIQKVKDELQMIMSHKIVILRDILSTLRQEQTFLLNQDYAALKSIVENRFVLIETFDEWSLRFFPVLKQLDSLLKNAADLNPEETFLDKLRELSKSLNEEDFELLLLREQLIEVIEEIQKQTSATLYFLENKPSALDHQNAHIQTNFLKFTIKEAQQKKAMVGLMESDQKDET